MYPICLVSVLIFQYILCYGSTYSGIGKPEPLKDFNTSYVTVQLTHIVFYNFKFNHFNTSYVTVQLLVAVLLIRCFQISIHPMLRFNLLCWLRLSLRSRISIHPMLRFNNDLVACKIFVFVFQYILCYGSTSSLYLAQESKEISIHPMLRFNLIYQPEKLLD